MAWWRKLLRRNRKPAPAMPDLVALCLAHGVPVAGVVHVGANRGDEIDQPDSMGAQRVVFIEANP